MVKLFRDGDECDDDCAITTTRDVMMMVVKWCVMVIIVLLIVMTLRWRPLSVKSPRLPVTGGDLRVLPQGARTRGWWTVMTGDDGWPALSGGANGA